MKHFYSEKVFRCMRVDYILRIARKLIWYIRKMQRI